MTLLYATRAPRSPYPRKSATTVEMCRSTLGVGALDDGQGEPLLACCRSRDLALMTAGGEQQAEEGEAAADADQQRGKAVAILDACGMHQGAQQQAQRVDQQMPLAASDGSAVDPARAAEPARTGGRVGIFLLASSPRGPPLSAVLTDRLSLLDRSAVKGGKSPTRQGCSWRKSDGSVRLDVRSVGPSGIFRVDATESSSRLTPSRASSPRSPGDA